MYRFSTNGICSNRINTEANGRRITLLVLKPKTEPLSKVSKRTVPIDNLTHFSVYVKFYSVSTESVLLEQISFKIFFFLIHTVSTNKKRECHLPSGMQSQLIVDYFILNNYRRCVRLS